MFNATSSPASLSVRLVGLGFALLGTAIPAQAQKSYLLAQIRESYSQALWVGTFTYHGEKYPIAITRGFAEKWLDRPLTDEEFQSFITSHWHQISVTACSRVHSSPGRVVFLQFGDGLIELDGTISC